MAANPSAMGEWTQIPEQDQGPAKGVDARMMVYDELTLETEMTQLAILVQRLALRYQMTRVQMLEHLSEAILGGPVNYKPGPTPRRSEDESDEECWISYRQQQRERQGQENLPQGKAQDKSSARPAVSQSTAAVDSADAYATIVSDHVLRVARIGIEIPHPGNPGEDVLHIGKHKGKTYQDIAENEPSYLKWVMTNPTNPDEGMSPQLKHFRKWLEARYRLAKLNKSLALVRKVDSKIVCGPMTGRIMPTENDAALQQQFDVKEQKTMEENIRMLQAHGCLCLPSTLSASSRRG